MTTFQFDWVDAFTTRAFGGNGCVVVHGGDDLDIESRLALVRETSLSECAYIVASNKADFGARYYLTDKEILMAGHPTIASVVSLIDRGLVDISTGQAEFTLEVGAGVLPIHVQQTAEGPFVTMTQLAPVFGKTYGAGEIANLVSLAAQDIVGTPQVVSTGTPFCITVLRDKDALRRAKLNTEVFLRLNPPGTVRADIVEPFLVTLGGETDQGDTYSRLLLPPPLPAEDPFTGSATGCMGAYLWHHGLMGKDSFTAEQGHWMGRPGQAQVTRVGSRDAMTGIKVAGQGYVLMRGELDLPEQA